MIAPGEPVRRGWWNGATALLGMAGYVGVLQLLVRTHTGNIAGVAADPGLAALSEAALQIAPFLFAITSLLSAPAWRAILRRRAPAGDGPISTQGPLVGLLLPCIIIALLFTTLTCLAVIGLAHGEVDGISITALALAAAGLQFDLQLVALFTFALVQLVRFRLIAAPLFLAYSVIVVLVGSWLGITTLIGFGSTSPVALTAFASAPLGQATAWLHRLYWLAITGAACCFAIWHAQRRAASSGGPRNLWLAGAVSCCAVAAGLGFGFASQSSAAPSSGPPLPPAYVGSAIPVRLQRYGLDLTYTPEKRSVTVVGTLVFVAEGRPADHLWLQSTGQIDLARLTVDAIGPYRVSRYGRWLLVHARDPITPGRRLLVHYRGTIRAGSRAPIATLRVFDTSFFLDSHDLLLTAPPPACIDPAASGLDASCPTDANYQFAPIASGTVNVTAPADISVVTSGLKTIVTNGTGQSVSRFTRSTRELTAFLVAGGHFRTLTRNAAGSLPPISIHVASDDQRAAGRAMLATAQDAAKFYTTAWPGTTLGPIQIVVVPNGFAEAQAYPGMLILSERLSTSRQPQTRAISQLLEFVLAHELSHQWWGYRLIPARRPGWLFVLESFPQFAAYRFMAHYRGLGLHEALAREEFRFQTVNRQHPVRATSLAQLDAGDAMAYTRGAQALLRIDAMSRSGLLAFMARTIGTFGYDDRRAVDPSHIIAALIADVPPNQRAWAKAALTSPRPPLNPPPASR